MEYIPHGSFVIEFVGEIINKPEFDWRFKQSVENEAKNLYFMSLEGGLYIDPTVHGNEARFMNHSCQPNCITKKWTAGGLTKIGLFASVDIPPVGLFIFFSVPHHFNPLSFRFHLLLNRIVLFTEHRINFQLWMGQESNAAVYDEVLLRGTKLQWYFWSTENI